MPLGFHRNEVLALWLAAVAAGCHSTSALTAPPLTDEAAVVLVGIGSELMIHAVDRSNEASELPAFSSIGPMSLYALGYGCSIFTLGLTSNRQSLNAEPSEALELPPPLSLSRSLLDDGDQGPWETLAEMPDEVVLALRHLKLAPGRACEAVAYEFRTRPGSISSVSTPNGGVTFGVLEESGEILFATSMGGFYSVIPGEEPVPVTTPDNFPSGAVYEHEGERWFVGLGGRIARGGPQNPSEIREVETSTRAERRMRVAGPLDDSPFELFLVNDQSIFEHFDGQRWELLSTGSGRRFLVPSVDWLGPGEAIAVGASPEDDMIARYDHGQVTHFELERGLGDVSTVQTLPRAGTLFGTGAGPLRWESGATVPFVTRSHPDVRASRIFGFYDVPNGFLFLNFSGRITFGQYHRGVGLCPVLTDVTDIVDWVLPLEDGLIIFERTFQDGPTARITRYDRVSHGLCSGDGPPF